MLKVKNGLRSTAATRLPATTVLGVAWLNGRFTALALHRGTLGTSWTCPRPVSSPNEFTEALKEAVSRTGFEGNIVSVVLGHVRLAQHWTEVPAAKQAQIAKFLSRQVQQHKPFEGNAVWANQPTVSTKNSTGVLLHLLPRQIHDELVDACEAAGLHLATLTPVHEALRSLLRQVAVADDEVALLAADTGTTTIVAMCRGDGTPLLARTVAESWGHDTSRVGIDLNRTALFAQQQFGRVVSQIILVGTDAESRAEAMKGFFEVPVRAYGGSGGDLVWAEEALRMSAETAVNLVTREQKEAPTRKVLLRFTLGVAAVMLTASVVLAAWVQRYYREEVGAIQRMEKIEQSLIVRHHDLAEAHQELARKERYVRSVEDTQREPVASWFLGYLSAAVPDDLCLTNVVVRAETNQWRVTLGGLVQPAAVVANRADVTKLTEQLKNHLSEGPFGVLCNSEVVAPAPGSTPATVGTNVNAYALWQQKLNRLTHNQTPDTRQFHIEGLMR